MHKGNFPEAIKLARKLTARYPKGIQSWRALSISLHKNNQFREVLEASRKGVELDPTDMICRLLLADTSRHTGALVDGPTGVTAEPYFLAEKAAKGAF